MMTSLPDSVGPARLIASVSRIACGWPPDDGAGQLVERLERRRAAGAVGGDADVALELAQRLLGLDTEQAVDAAAVEAHVEQPLLQRADVVAGHQPRGHVGQDPVAEAPAGLVQRVVGRAADDAVDGEPALLLERAHRAVGRRRRTRCRRVPDQSVAGLSAEQVRARASLARISATAGPVSPRR